MTREWFDEQMGKLALLPFAPADIDGHWEDLREIPEPILEGGILYARRTRTRFPVPAEIRADCDAAVRRQQPQAVPPTSRMVPVEGTKTVVIQNPFGGDPITVHVGQEPYRVCDDCDDSGSVLLWCAPESAANPRAPWMYRRPCNRQHPHGAHDYAIACPCVPTNRVIQERLAARAVKYSQEPNRAA